MLPRRLVEYFVTVGIDPECVSELNNSEEDVTSVDSLPQSAVFNVKIDTLDGSLGMVDVGFTVLAHTLCTGKDACIRKKKKVTMTGMHVVKHYLCLSYQAKNDREYPISRISLTSVKNKREASELVTRSDSDFLKLDDKHYLCLKRDTSAPPIIDLCLIDLKSEKVPFGFTPLSFAIGPHSLTICIKTRIGVSIQSRLWFSFFVRKAGCMTDVRFETCILDRWPRTERSDEKPLSNTTSVFCQPSGAQVLFDNQPMPTYLSFVLTDANGIVMYAMTVTFFQEMDSEFVSRLPKRILPMSATSKMQEYLAKGGSSERKFVKCFSSRSVCVLSYHPFMESFKECLKEVYRVSCSKGQVPIEYLVYQLCEQVRMPERNVSDTVLKFVHRKVTFHIPRFFELQRCYDDDTLALEPLFKCLSVENIILVVRALLTQEFKLIFHSRHPSLLTPVMQACLVLIEPLQWQFTYVPVLPINLLATLVDAPVPMVIGIHSDNLRTEFFHPSKELVIVNVDCDSVYVPSLSGGFEFLAISAAGSGVDDWDISGGVTDISKNLIQIPRYLEDILVFELEHYAHVSNLKRYTASELCDEVSATTLGIGSAFAVAALDDESLDSDRPFSGTECRLAFLHLIVGLFGAGAPASLAGRFDLKNYMLFPEDLFAVQSVRDMFDVGLFLNDISGTLADGSVSTAASGSAETLSSKQAKSLRHFWSHFSESQSFSNFVSDAMQCSDLDSLISDAGLSTLVESGFELTADRIACLKFFESCLNAGSRGEYMAAHECVAQIKLIGKGGGKSAEHKPFSPSIGGRRPSFRAWYFDQVDAGNRINDALVIAEVSVVSAEQCKQDPGLKDYVYEPLPNGGFRELSDDLFESAKKRAESETEVDSGADTESAAKRRASLEQKLTLTSGAGSMRLKRGGSVIVSSSAGQLSRSKSPLDRAQHALVQVFGAWMSVCLAYADNMFFENKAESAEFVNRVLEVLFDMSTLALRPDEMIFKSCLILCGKFGRQEESVRVMRALKSSRIKASPATYGAYANAMASTQASYGGSAMGSTASSTGSRKRYSSVAKRQSIVAIASSSSTSGLRGSIGGPTSIATALRSFDTIDEEKSISGIGPGLDGMLVTRVAAERNEMEEKLDSPLVTSTVVPTGTPKVSVDLPPVVEDVELDRHSPTPPPEESLAMPLALATAPMIFDYSTLKMDSSQECECGFVLSDAHIMHGWYYGPLPSPETNPGLVMQASVVCPVCEQAVHPTLKVCCDYSTVSADSKTVESGRKFYVEVSYLSPSELREQCAELAGSHSKALGLIAAGDSEIFRDRRPVLFWNLVWYLGHRQKSTVHPLPTLALDLILGEHDCIALSLEPMECNDDCCQYPRSDEEVSAQVSGVIQDLSKSDVTSAVKKWLKLRQSVSADAKGKSVWDVSVPRAFDLFNASKAFPTQSKYNEELSAACTALRARPADCPPSKEVLAFDSAFGHGLGLTYPRLASFSL